MLFAFITSSYYIAMLQEELRTGEKAVVLFKFIKHPEYLKVGAKMLFREGVTKGIGHVTNLQPLSYHYQHFQGQDEKAWSFLFRPSQLWKLHPSPKNKTQGALRTASHLSKAFWTSASKVNICCRISLFLSTFVIFSSKPSLPPLACFIFFRLWQYRYFNSRPGFQV